MPLGEAALALLSVALRDAQVVTRYRDKIAAVPGSDCLYWCHAISGRGHGRFYVGTLPAGQGAEQRDLCMIAHRFGYALVYGADALQQVPVLGHGCDNPLCQRIGPGHVQPSSHAQNRRAYLARRFVAGSPLGDARGARGRSRQLRDLSRAEPAAVAAEQVRLLRLGLQLALFET